ncbi:hypothetical protein COCON_G00228960 [Conger conger]|uniref:Uncharacterized protein n=1 Tax=Conger conger TaxID=82655 RepID=A0A9Q1CU54_CONCO|nr:hypothetical protein COCON_G00228960 [Conger conger]
MLQQLPPPSSVKQGHQQDAHQDQQLGGAVGPALSSVSTHPRQARPSTQCSPRSAARGRCHGPRDSPSTHARQPKMLTKISSQPLHPPMSSRPPTQCSPRSAARGRCGPSPQLCFYPPTSSKAINTMLTKISS